MAKSSILFLAIVCTLVATVAATRYPPQPYQVTGKVYCDTCQCGFETNVTHYIPGATVELECLDNVKKIVYKDRAVTDKNGSFKFIVKEDHEDETCEVVLVKSPWSHCSYPDPGRSRSRVIVTDFNGIKSFRRYANNMGFFQDHTLPVCAQLLKYYLYSE